MTSPARTALRTLRRAVRALAHPRLPDDVRTDAAETALAALELIEAADRRRVAGDALARRVAQLDRQLADRDAGQRQAIIRERLGLSRATYYRALSRSRETPEN